MDKNNFKNTCVFAACGVICVTLLGISTMSYADSMYTSDTDTLNIELDDSLYNGLLSLSLSSDNQDSPGIDNLYVFINGKEYPVIENEDGQLVAQNVIPDESLNTTADIPLTDTGSSRYSVDADGNKVYHIIWGDTLSELAVEFGNSVDELAVYNHIPDPNLIYAEDDLYLPR
ncbi:MAG: LysM domain-containing protein [Lachnospiraceae bacterium]|nr:LysM domain-containing protein [Lachnospiraceae bacterium]